MARLLRNPAVQNLLFIAQKDPRILQRLAALPKWLASTRELRIRPGRKMYCFRLRITRARNAKK
jgi:hypothetical protein